MKEARLSSLGVIEKKQKSAERRPKGLIKELEQEIRVKEEKH